MSSETVSVLEPPVYDFNDWDEFCESALRYHNATRPNDHLLIDRIETFRNYMSDRTINWLSGFVRPHPRFDTVEGWDLWVVNVAQAISIRDALVIRDRTPQAPFASETDALIAFKKGKINRRGLWTALDMLTANGSISEKDQRQLFWDALPESDQSPLVEQCAYFDPQDRFWNDCKPGDAAVASQNLSRIMEFSFVDDELTRYRHKLRLVVVWIVLLTILRLAWTGLGGIGLFPDSSSYSAMMIDTLIRGWSWNQSPIIFIVIMVFLRSKNQLEKKREELDRTYSA